MIKSESQKQLELIRAAQENDLSVLLRPYFTFRLFVKFKKRYINPVTKKIMDANHCYGIENVCSYSQCLSGHFENIVLDKQMGFKNCIRLIEERYCEKGVPTYRFAQIYQRVKFPGGGFDILNRHYNHKGERVEQLLTNRNEMIIPKEPVISPEDNMILYFKVNGGLLNITEEVIPSAADFRKLVTESLNI
jgi:hypothetical protein